MDIDDYRCFMYIGTGIAYQVPRNTDGRCQPWTGLDGGASVTGLSLDLDDNTRSKAVKNLRLFI